MTANREGILIVGCGYVGCALGCALVAQQHRVWGLRRSAGKIRTPDVTQLKGDVTNPASLNELPKDISIVVYAVSPNAFDDLSYSHAYVDGIANTLAVLKREAASLKRFIMLSSTSVYSQDDASWVDETSEAKPRHFSGERILEGERLVAASGFRSTILRLGFIYGPERADIISTDSFFEAEGHVYYNFIHLVDCINAIRFIVGCSAAEQLYLVVDDEPALRSDVVRWLRSQFKTIQYSAENRTPRKPPRGNKRCSNAKIRSSGFQLAYPTFKEGLSEIIEMLAAKGLVVR